MHMVRKLLAAIIILGAIISGAAQVSAEEQPYESYTYNYWGNAVPAPQAYLPECEISGETLGIGRFSFLTDLFVDTKDNVYLLDSGGNKVVCLDSNWKVKRIISGFEKEGKQESFKNPQGIYVTDKGDIYIADTDNGRIVVLDENGNYVRDIGKPDTKLLSQDFVYKPVKVALDKALRLYIVAQNVNQGILEFDAQGDFKTFMGAAKVFPDMSDIIFKSIATKEQRKRMELFVPTEYNNLFIDHEGFIWGTVSALNQYEVNSAIQGRDKSDRVAPVRRLNPTGTDVLKRNGAFPPNGEVAINFNGALQGASSIIDVVAEENGVYSVLDQKRGRVFTYDSDGNLLFVFGSLGNRAGTFGIPNSMEKMKDRILVTDSKRNAILVFRPTTYGLNIVNAITEYKNGNYEESFRLWSQVLDCNANYEYAYQGMGKCSIRQEKYEEAMQYFKLANDRYYYSKAFKYYRKTVVEKYFGVLVIAGILLFVLCGLFKKKYAIRHRIRTVISR